MSVDQPSFSEQLLDRFGRMPQNVLDVTATVLTIGVIPLGEGYSTLMRLIAFPVMLWAAVIAHACRSNRAGWFFVLLAIVYNPFIQVAFDHPLWLFVHISAAVLLVSKRSLIVRTKDDEPPPVSPS